jgi:hypothetical protein
MSSELTYRDITLGSFEFDQIVDSGGAPLIEAAPSGAPDAVSDFVFELGVFNEGFTPLIDNLDEWAENWNTFDVALMAAEPVLIGIQGGLTANGETVSEHPNADSGVDFSGRDAFLWIYNSQDLAEGTEWFVGRASDWVFPEIDLLNSDCSSCPGESPVQWSTSQFNGDTVVGTADVPLFGSQSGVQGAGSVSEVDADFTLQTAVVVPEPSTLILPTIIGLLAVWCRMQKRGRA